MLALRLPLVLASASPRRQDLLARLGLTFDVRPTDADETWPAALAPGPAAEEVALRKARALDAPGALVLAADTVVVLDGDVLGKPADAAEAARTLRRLSGREHTVTTGLALRLDGREATAHETTRVRFAPLSDEEVAAYVATGSPLDKAGSYGIQDDLGALLVERIDGDYFNVVGLPLRRLYETLRRFVPTHVSLSMRPLLVLAAALLVAACGDPAPEPTPEPEPAPAADARQTVDAIAAANPQLSTLARLVGVADLGAVLADTAAAYTLFAPTDAAFAALGADALAALEADPEALRAVLLDHVLPTRMLSVDVFADLAVESVGGAEIAFLETADGLAVRAHGTTAQVTEADLDAENGVVHLIDAVLAP